MAVDLPPADWPVAFIEEFDELRLGGPQRPGGVVWATTYPWGGRTNPPNRELQLYVDPGWRGRDGRPSGLDPFSVRDGVLTITARPVPPEDRGRHDGFAYASGMLTSYGSFSQTYGYFEMRARMPEGRGLWPAFWLLPVHRGWPPEIDVVEVLGHRPHDVWLTLHTGAGGRHQQIQRRITGPDTSAGFHTYGLRWTPATITWFLDGQAVAEVPTPADMHQPMYALANLAVGGTTPGTPDSSTRFPAEFRIDYIRVHRMPAPDKTGGEAR